MNEESIKDKAAVAIVSEAENLAKKLVETAARQASRMQDESTEDRMTKALSNSLREVFGENTDSGRFIDVKRIPLICQNINGMHDMLKEIKEDMVSQKEFWPIKTIVYSGVGTILLAVIGAIIALVINK